MYVRVYVCMCMYLNMYMYVYTYMHYNHQYHHIIMMVFPCTQVKVHGIVHTMKEKTSQAIQATVSTVDYVYKVRCTYVVGH